MPAGGSIEVTESTIVGTFISNQKESTLGLNKVNNAEKVLFKDLYVNIPSIKHGANSSIIMNILENVTDIIFDNTSFSVANTEDGAHVATGGNFGGYCGYIINSTFTIKNSEITSDLYFNGNSSDAFEKSGTMVGVSNNSIVRIHNISANG